MCVFFKNLSILRIPTLGLSFSVGFDSSLGMKGLSSKIDMMTCAGWCWWFAQWLQKIFDFFHNKIKKILVSFEPTTGPPPPNLWAVSINMDLLFVPRNFTGEHVAGLWTDTTNLCPMCENSLRFHLKLAPFIFLKNYTKTTDCAKWRNPNSGRVLFSFFLI